MSNKWQHGLFECLEDRTLCIISYFLPCYQFGKNMEAVGENCVMCGACCMLPPCDFILPALYRGKIREVKGIEGSLFEDCVTWMFCPFCALAQEAQEVCGQPPVAPEVNAPAIARE